jgi:5-methylcytosine-specific restriction endonuclease McrA
MRSFLIGEACAKGNRGSNCSLKNIPCFRKRVLERDSWRCQECGSMKDLQVHRMKARSRLGGNLMQNLLRSVLTAIPEKAAL